MTEGAFRAPERAAAERALELQRRLTEVEGQFAAAASRRAELTRTVAQRLRGPRPVPAQIPLAVGFVFGLAAAAFLYWPWGF